MTFIPKSKETLFDGDYAELKGQLENLFQNDKIKITKEIKYRMTEEQKETFQISEKGDDFLMKLCRSEITLANRENYLELKKQLKLIDEEEEPEEVGRLRGQMGGVCRRHRNYCMKEITDYVIQDCDEINAYQIENLQKYLFGKAMRNSDLMKYYGNKSLNSKDKKGVSKRDTKIVLNIEEHIFAEASFMWFVVFYLLQGN